MLAGRYPSDEFAELRPRIVWDRTAGVIRGRTGARRLAVTNAGTIPDRGLFGVFQVDGGGRVGELDEEMVYEAREGQTFMLGASTWRIEEITRDRVLVSPAPGVPGAVPFWKGEGVGRPYELGARIGAASRELVGALRRRGDQTTASRLPPRRARAARNLLAFLREQERARALPTDRTIVVERFRDEIGDWRVCVLTPFGGRVHAPWAMALAARLRDALGARGAVALVGRRHRAALPRRRRAARARRPPRRARGARGPRRAGGGPDGALRRTVPRERRARAAHPAAAARAAHAAVAAAPQGAEPARGGAAVRLVPDRPRDLPGVPAGRVRPACAARDPARPLDAGARPRRGRDAVRLADGRVAPLRLRRDLHVRGRHARGGAPRAGALARPRAAARAARPGGAPRAARPGRARRGRGVAAAASRETPTSCTTSSGASATCARASSTPASRRPSCASDVRSARVSAATRR